MAYEIVNDFPNEIIYENEGPFISLYQRTERDSLNNKKNLIKFNNLLDEIKESLGKKYSQKEIDSLIKPLNEIGEDRRLWNRVSEGLAVLANPSKCVVYILQRPVKEIAVVADSFHIKPLLRNFQSADRYHVLGIGRDNFVLYEGNRYGFEEVKLDEDMERTRQEVLGDQHPDSYLSQGSYDGAGGTPMFHGHGGRKDEIEKDIERYFRYVDKFILDNYSNPMNIPLILAALDEHQGLFRNISRNNYLLDKGIRKDYESLSKSEIREEAWKVIEPVYLDKTEKLVEEYNFQRSKFLASDDVAEVGRAAVENRVKVLLVDDDKIVSGKINKETGELGRKEIENPEVDDVLDDISEIVLKNNGEVVVLPTDKMPSDTGLAAVYRF